MIVKLDHIAYSCLREEIDIVCDRFQGYHQVFREQDLPNPEIKRQLMQKWSAVHDIVLLNKTSEFPVEITAYDTISHGSKYELSADHVIVNTSSIGASSFFYNTIGFKQKNSMEMCFRSLMDEKAVVIRYNETQKSVSTYLDTDGYSCIAFWTNSADKEKKRLEKRGVNTTGIVDLCVNKKNLSVFFAYNEYGDICEFISLKEVGSVGRDNEMDR